MTTITPTGSATVAEELVSFCRAGRNMDAINTLYSPEIVSVESMGTEQMPREMKGFDAIRQKYQWLAASNEVNSALHRPKPSTTISERAQLNPWRFKATCGHVKHSAKALARRLCAGFFHIR